jgi:peptidyl-prolyl cis-trans isomerase B (cyclophilin B)
MEKVLFEIEMTSGAVMKGEMYPEVAPISVENFKDLIEKCKELL